jgi:glutaredoxin
MELKQFIGKVVISISTNKRYRLHRITSPYIDVESKQPNSSGYHSHYRFNSCESSVRTEKVLESVVDELRHAFKIAGYDLEYHKVLIETAEMATAYRFLSSPTIRVNGRDIWNSAKAKICGCCEDIDGTPLAEIIAEEIIKWALVPKLPSFLLNEYVLPDDLKKFFDGKR